MTQAACKLRKDELNEYKAGVLKSCLDAVSAQADTIEDIYDDIIANHCTETNRDAWTIKQAECLAVIEKQKEKCQQPYLDYLDRVHKRQIQNIAQDKKVKEAKELEPRPTAARAEVLKPEILSHDALPIVKEKWIDEWNNYFTAANINTYTEAELFGFLAKCVDADLY